MSNLEYLMNVRREEALKEAEHHRLISKAQQRSSRIGMVYRKALSGFGGRLCRLGNVLQARFGEADSSGAIGMVNGSAQACSN